MKAILSVILTFSMASSSVVASPVSSKPLSKTIASNVINSDIFGKINAHRQQNGVSLNWSVINPNEVTSFIIERSWDGSYFEVINEVAVNNGVNRYRDNDIFPGHLYYRITARMADGSEISSEVEMVRIVKNG